MERTTFTLLPVPSLTCRILMRVADKVCSNGFELAAGLRLDDNYESLYAVTRRLELLHARGLVRRQRDWKKVYNGRKWRHLREGLPKKEADLYARAHVLYSLP